MEKLNIVVISGGISTEKEVSINTGKEIFKNINKEKYNVEELIINEKKDIFKLLDMNVDFAYIALHGIFGEDGMIQAILDSMDIKYTGSDTLSSAICMDKDLSKFLCKNMGVNVIPGDTIEKDNIKSFSEYKKLGEKLVLKPFDGGSSIGVFIVDNEKDFNFAISEIFKISKKIIVEKYIKGIEISTPVIDNKVYPTVMITPLISDTFDYKAKYLDNGSREEVHFFDDEIQNKINKYALLAYKACKCSVFARIDFLIEDNEVYMLEINTLPGMTKNSIFPRSIKYTGINYSELLDLIIEKSLRKG